MAFKGKTGALTLSEVLALCVAGSEPGTIEVSSGKRTFHLEHADKKLTGIISGDPLLTLIEILKSKNLISQTQLETLEDNPEFDTDPGNVLTQLKIIKKNQFQLLKYYQAEILFFELLEQDEGKFELNVPEADNILKFDLAFRDWVSVVLPDIEKLKADREFFPDLDARLFWKSPEEISKGTETLTLHQLKILAEYKPGITVRDYWYQLDIPKTTIMGALTSLSEHGILTIDGPDKVKPPDSRPFLRLLLGTVVDKLAAVQDLVGETGEFTRILNGISSSLSGEQSIRVDSEPEKLHDNLDDLSSITSSIEDLLTMEDLESLEIKPEHLDQDVAKPDLAEEALATSSNISDTGEWLKADLKQPEKETGPETSAYEEGEDEILTIEDQVEAKVTYRRFVSNVTMSSNRLKFRKMNYFEMLGVPPNADKRAIHKAFVKAIRKINPKGVRLGEFDKKYLEMAVSVRDELKIAYKALTEPKLRRQYLSTQKKSREVDEKKKSEAMLFFNRGMVEFKNNKFQKAKELFLKAAKLDPNSPVYYNMLEDIDKEERSSNAMKFYQAGILAFSKKNDPDRAIKLIRKAMSLAAGQVIFYVKLAEIQAANPATRNDAVQTYEEVMELDPSNVELRHQYAGFLYSLGMKQEAANSYQDILKWDPDNSPARKKLIGLRKEGVKPKKSTEKADSPEESEDIDF